MSVALNLKLIRSELPPEVQLIAVSKFQSNEAIEEAYKAGQRVFGESKVQEMTTKNDILPKDIKWHFIGHLQTNKIKHIVPYVAMIHGVDSYKLLEEINKQAEKSNRVINCLLQIHIAQEETKFGFSAEECNTMLSEKKWETLRHIQICGLMGMASNTNDNEQIAREFRSLNTLFNQLKSVFFSNSDTFHERSMGMSQDYQQAIAEGSTLVRIGSSIFGERIYT